MKTTHPKKTLAPILAAAAFACLFPLATFTSAQAAPQQGAHAAQGANAAQGGDANSATPADSSDVPTGLDALVKDNERTVLDELSNDGLTTLLDREFEVDNTPTKDRSAIKAVGSIRILNDPNAKLTPRQRVDLTEQVANGLELAKNSLPKRASRLEQYAQSLIGGGMNYFESTLEYWGESPSTQAQLKPIADAVCDLYKMAADAAEEECGIAATHNDLAKARDLDGESTLDNYYANVFQFDRALATDATNPAGKALRKQICQDAVDKLQSFDTADSTVQPIVELYMAKDLMLEGKTKDADALFDNVIAGKTTPAPRPDQLNDAYYFKTVANILGKDPAGAKKAMADLTTFTGTLPGLLQQAKWNQKDIDGYMNSVDVDNRLLQYRSLMLDSDLSQNPSDKNNITAQAAQALTDLAKKHPEYQQLINQQLVNCLPPTEPVTKMSPMLLAAVMNKGDDEYHRAPEQRDVKVLQRGLDAAKEILTRADRTGIDADMTESAAKTVPAFELALGNSVDAINAYLDYIEKYKDVATHHDDADAMVHVVYGIVEDVQRTAPATAGLGPAYERFLKDAVNPPFNYSEFDYAYALMLKGQGHLTEAADIFLKVPASDPHYASARNNLLAVDKQLVDTPVVAADRTKHDAEVKNLMSVATEIKDRYASSTKDDDRYEAACAMMIAGQTAINDLHDPKAALSATDDLEKEAAGLKEEKAFDIAGLFIRYNAYMAINQPAKAVAVLVDLMKIAPGDTGAKLVHDQLDALDKQFDIATANNDTDQMRSISRNEAKLSGFLVDWAHNNTNPANRKAYYGYAVWDAKIKRIAGTLEDDPSAKQEDLEAALKQFQFLASDAGHKLYLEQLPASKTQDPDFDPKQPDTFVEANLAFTQHDLRDYADAQKTLADLLFNKRLGDTSSDLYWQGTYDLYDCNYQLAQAGNADAKKNLPQTESGLKGIYIIGGIPAKWQGSFDGLRTKMIPDWKVPEETTGKQQSASSK